MLEKKEIKSTLTSDLALLSIVISGLPFLITIWIHCVSWRNKYIRLLVPHALFPMNLRLVC